MSLYRNWVKFNELTKERGFNHHHFTINHNGQIHLGRQAHTDLGRPRAVMLYYEPDLNKIAIEPSDKHTPGTVPLIAKTMVLIMCPARSSYAKTESPSLAPRPLPSPRSTTTAS